MFLVKPGRGARRNPGATQAAAGELVGEGTGMHGAKPNPNKKGQNKTKNTTLWNKNVSFSFCHLSISVAGTQASFYYSESPDLSARGERSVRCENVCGENC